MALTIWLLFREEKGKDTGEDEGELLKMCYLEFLSQNHLPQF